MSALLPIWDAVAPTLAGLRDHPSRPLLYSLPPTHLFYAEGPILAQKFHNWLRIGPWIVGESLYPVRDGRVQLTTRQWRIALEGAYYRPSGMESGIRPQASEADIARLPDAPPRAKRPRIDGVTGEEGSAEDEAHGAGSRSAVRVGQPRAGLSSAQKRSQQRGADRADIAVRLGVHAGFAPYDAEHDMPGYRGVPISRAMVEENRPLWSTLVWEIDALHFRIELCDLDRVMAPELYSSTDASSDREEELYALWGETAGLVPQSQQLRGLDSSDRAEQADALCRLANVMRRWSNAEHKFTASRPAGQDPGKFAELVARHYATAFHAEYGRLPHLPRVCPPPPQLAIAPAPAAPDTTIYATTDTPASPAHARDTVE